ncbi:cyclin-dependent kinase inhibitor 2c-related [Anaeramoeba ignava]|uniref:Cyclin-dependent kinase inhibitor 2c-related n=1 Tax=Anaeramoeba ignava TaxID=1746090 RepID=A0A9Q0L6X0_ANAIG|nr:cyclin-dependent kinase inhibitor 2c-related [Anaeramoeba ignava]
MQNSLNNSLLQICFQQGTLDQIQKLVLKGASVNCKGNYAQTPLHFCIATQKNIEIISYLISSGAKINAVNDFGKNPLHLACEKYPQFEILKLLLENGADPKIVDKSSKLPVFHLFNQKSNLDLIKLFIGPNFPIDQIIFQTKTSLIAACQNQADLDVIEFLLEKGANVNFIDDTKKTPLHHLCCSNPNDLSAKIHLLFKYHPNLNLKDKSGKTPLHYLCSNSQFSLIKFLVENGADVNIQDSNFLSPIFYLSFKKSSIDIFNFLIDHRASIYYTARKGNQLIHQVCKKKPSLEMLQILIKKGTNVNSQTYRSKTPIYFAIKHNASLNCIKFLLKNNADTQINSHYSLNRNLLNIAYNNNSKSIMKLLLKKQLDFEIKKSKSLIYIFQDLLKKKNLKIFKLLLSFDLPRRLEEDFYPKDQTLQFISSYSSFQQDFLKLFQKGEFTDYQIKCKDGSIYAHKLILEFRLPVFKDKEKMQEMMQIFSNFPIVTVSRFMEFVYSAFIPFGSTEYLDFISVLENAKLIPKGWTNPSRPKHSLLKDYIRLYKSNDTKDFGIIVEEKKIKVHRLILIARSELFRGMFLSVNDESDTVHDYSGNSFETMENLIHFFYTDKFPSHLNSSVKQELEETKDYFLLNESSFLDFRLNPSSNY